MRCLWAAGSLLGEGPVWDDRLSTLYFVDIRENVLAAFDDEAGGRLLPLGDWPSCVALTENGDEIVCASRRGIERVRVSSRAARPTGAVVPLAPGMRFNDGKCDAAGRLWIGTMDDAERSAVGALYRIGTGGEVSPVLTGLGVTNGLDWSPDDRWFYHTDSLRRTISRFRFEPETGALSGGEPFAVVPASEGAPDGLTVDEEGFVWSAHWDGWRVTRYAPDGRVDRVIRLPVPRPTSVAFGGEDYRTLFITSACAGLSVEVLRQAPLSGALFACEPGPRGRPANRARV